jgi:transcriptional regulator with XRE-family HTH domain
VEPLDPALFEDDEMRAALAARDIGKVYRYLRRLGISQRQTAQLTGQSQSEVSEIIRGRQVRDVTVLERIADGLGLPRARLGVSYGEKAPEASSAEEEVDEDVKRRALIATTSAAALGEVLLGLGEPIGLALATAHALPSQLSISHVQIVRAVTERLRGVSRCYGGQAGLFGAAATIYTRWMQVPAPEATKAQLAAALAELHTEAGWCCYDEGVDGTGHFTRALRLAGEAKDVCGVANAALHAGATLVRGGHPNDALKLFQLGQFHLRLFPSRQPTPGTVPADPQLAILTAQLTRQSATAYAVMKGPDEADHYLAEANDGWEPQHAFQRAGADLVAAGIQLDLGRLETAEQLAASAARTYSEGRHRRGRVEAELMVAEAHVRAGEPQGLTLARHAITEVSTLHSVAARRERLMPLATALNTRPGIETQELARKARHIAAREAGDTAE